MAGQGKFVELQHGSAAHGHDVVDDGPVCGPEDVHIRGYGEAQIFVKGQTFRYVRHGNTDMVYPYEFVRVRQIETLT